MAARVLLVAAVLAAAGARAHDKMTSPLPRLGQAATESTASPCGADTTIAGSRVTLQRGETLPMSWDGNHGGSVTIRLAPQANTPEFDPANNPQAVDLGTITFPANQGDGSVIIPSDASQLPDGAYTLQWRWQNYYSCADLTIQGDCPTVLVSVGLQSDYPQETARTVGTSFVVSTVATSSAGRPRRLVAESTNGRKISIGSVGIPDCNGAPAGTSFSDEAELVCVDLPLEDNDVKYYQVRGNGAIIDTGVDFGDCASIQTSTAAPTTAITASTVTATAALAAAAAF